MFKIKLTLACLLLLSLHSLAGAQESSVIHCGGLIDTEQGRLLGERWISVSEGQITAINKTPPGQPATALIDLSELTCLPGLMDMHVHLDGQLSRNGYIKRYQLNPADYALVAANHARKTLAAGFTTVRNLGDAYNVTVALREAIDRGVAVGPRIYTAAKSIATTGGHADPTNGYRADLVTDPGPESGVINSPAEARKAVRQRYKDGADLIKITATGGVLSLAKSGQNPQFSEVELNALIEAADDYGLHVAAHAHGTEGMKRAVSAGVKSIEHGTYMSDEVMQLMKKHGTFYVPTISAGVFVGQKAQEDDYFPAVVRPKAAAIGPIIRETFAKAHRAGVKIAFGTDSGVSPHGENAAEFVYMVDAGMQPMQAILSATQAAAELLNEPRLGSLQAGKWADIIAVKGDPTQSIEILQEVLFVMKGGSVYKQP